MPDWATESTFLWGARQTGKSTLLKKLYFDVPLSYWCTASQVKVDFILGNHEVAVETKSTSMVNQRHLKGLKHFAEEYKVKKLIIVSTDPQPRQIENILVLPWRIFLQKLWADEIIQ